MQFDLHKLFAAIDAKRQHRDLSWAELSSQVGVSASTIRRFSKAHDAEADGVLALVRWLEDAPEDYISNSSVKRKLLHPPGDGYTRADMTLVAKANPESRSTNSRTRTTIQHLVETAQQSGQPVASLTRLNEV